MIIFLYGVIVVILEINKIVFYLLKDRFFLILYVFVSIFYFVKWMYVINKVYSDLRVSIIDICS